MPPKTAQKQPRRINAEVAKQYARHYLDNACSHTVSYRMTWSRATGSEIREWSPVIASHPRIVAALEAERAAREGGMSSGVDGVSPMHDTSLSSPAERAYRSAMFEFGNPARTLRERGEALKMAQAARRLMETDSPSDTPQALLDWLAGEHSTCPIAVRSALSPVIAGSAAV